MNFQLVSTLLRSVWLIPQEVAESYYHQIAFLLNGKSVDFEFGDFDVKLMAANGQITSLGENPDFSQSAQQSVAVFPISGPLMKNDQECGPVGMKSIGQMIQRADQSDNIKGIILNIESPGGQAQGTSQLADIIKATTKPVVAYVDGIAASAAYWIASAADKIIAEPKSTIGSIGTMTSFADIQPALELQGVKFHKIVSDQTPDKNALMDQIRMGNYDQFKKEVLNPLSEDFINAIKTNRPNIKADQLTGKTFYSENVTGSMIDQVGSFADALAAIEEIANNKSQNSKTQISNTKPNQMNKYPKINQALGTELEMTDEGIYLNQEQLDAIETAMGTVAAAAEPEPVSAAPAPAPQPPADPRIEELLKRIEAMESQPGAETAKTIATNDPGNTNGVKLAANSIDFWTNVQNVAKEYLNQ